MTLETGMLLMHLEITYTRVAGPLASSDGS
jgi:hypothetical protein